MNIFNNPILVTLTDSDPFINLQTYDEKHGRSQHFYLRKETLQGQLGNTAERCVTEADLLNFCTVARTGNDIRFTAFWLHGNYSDDISGYRQTFFVPVDKAAVVLTGEKVKHLSYIPVHREKAKLSFTSSANKAIAAADKLKRHALRRFFRDAFDYGRDEKLVVQQDPWVNGFYFFSPVSKFEGGIVLHETEVVGKDGKPHRKVYYGLHT